MAVRRKPTQTSNNKGTKEQNDWTGYFVIDKRSWREYNSFMQRDGISSLERWSGLCICLIFRTCLSMLYTYV